MSGTGSALLDTNIVIACLKRDWAVRSRWQMLSNLYLPLTALGELYYGAYKAVRHDHVLTQIHDLLRVVILLTPTHTTAKYYGQIKAELAGAGTPIPQNDIWIAALAKKYQLPLATRDRHFKQVRGLVTLDG
jgi:tRNA(fMet)-specific endonuclease VapC